MEQYEYEIRHKPTLDGAGHFANVYEMKVYLITDSNISELFGTYEGYSKQDLIYHARSKGCKALVERR